MSDLEALIILWTIGIVVEVLSIVLYRYEKESWFSIFAILASMIFFMPLTAVVKEFELNKIESIGVFIAMLIFCAGIASITFWILKIIAKFHN